MKKNLIIILSIIMAFTTAFTAFAAINSTNEAKFGNGERPTMPENMITGKIKSIDANSVTIEVATMKEMEKPEFGQNNNDMKKPPENAKNDFQNGNPPEKPNFDNMFTLTGETKTINISQAEFGKDFKIKDFKGKIQEDNASNNSNAFDNAKQKTYADYAVGDYITIEATDNTYKTAKRVRDAGMFGGPRDMSDRKDKKDPPNN